MKKSLSTFGRVATFLQIGMATMVIALAIWNLIRPETDPSEFGGLYNFSLFIFAFLSLILGILIFLFSVFQLKVKSWAYITNLILTTILFPVLAVSHLNGFVFELMPDFSLSLTKEIIPGIILFLQILSFRNYFR